MIYLNEEDVLAARSGDRAALEVVLRTVERPIYNLALRMLAHPADAEDATQEILIKILTHLGGIEEPAAAGGWALRVACRHLVRERKKGRVEAMRLSFEGFAADLDRDRAPLTYVELTDVEASLAIEEVKIGCTLAMLTCLTRDMRIAYLLGEVFELSDNEAAPVLEISPAAYRQRLKRARDAVTEFTRTHCGIVETQVSCRCESRVAPALAKGRVLKGQSAYPTDRQHVSKVEELRMQVTTLEDGRAAAALMRSNPTYQTQLRDLVLTLVDQGQMSL